MRKFKRRLGQQATDRVCEPLADSRLEAAAYIAELSADLARIARGQGLHTLSYLLDMARLEACGVVGVEAPEDARIS